MIDVEKYAAYYWLNKITRGRQQLQEEMRSFYGGIENLWLAGKLDDVDYVAFLGEKQSEKTDSKAVMREALALMKKVSQCGMGVLSRDDENYPSLLRECRNGPAVLYYQGKVEMINGCRKRLAVVGSRKCTSYGREMCLKLVSGLDDRNICVVSGLARGIDAFAHKAALDSDIFTVGVVASGIDVVYPRENAGLYSRIRETGVIMSEQPPGTQPLRTYFPARNRIIAGVAEATFVVEAGNSSGALITADFALDAGRDVMTIPHRIDTPEGAGCNYLIKSGALCVTSQADVLSALGFETGQEPGEAELMTEALDEIQREVFLLIRRNGELVEDEIISETGISSQEIKRALSALEIYGFIKKDFSGKFYAI